MLRGGNICGSGKSAQVGDLLKWESLLVFAASVLFLYDGMVVAWVCPVVLGGVLVLLLFVVFELVVYIVIIVFGLFVVCCGSGISAGRANLLRWVIC